MKIIKVNADKDLVLEIESLSCEVVAMKTIIKSLLEDNPNNRTIIDTPVFIEYSKRFQDKINQYERLKFQISEKYKPQEIIDNNLEASWNLDYETGVITYTIK